MWETMKFIMPLLLFSAIIVTIDQYNKKGYYWKVWAGATIIGCFIYTLAFVVGPPDITPSGNFKDSDSVTSSGQSTPTNKPGTGNKSAEQVQQSQQIEQNNQQQSPGQSGNPQQNSGEAENPGQDTVIPWDVLLPVDEANLNASFKEFRDKFISAVNSKDLTFLKNHLSPNIRYSFGDNNGIKGFLHQWQLNTNPEKSPVWPELAQVLALGGSFDKEKAVFTAPYVFANFPSTIDSFENVVVIAQNVSIHSAPNPASPVIMGLSYKILKLADSKFYKSTGTQPGESANWRKVETSSGDGFINEAYTSSPIDYRAQFRQEEGQWKMVFFVAGD